MKWILLLVAVLASPVVSVAADDVSWKFDKRLTDLEKRVSDLEKNNGTKTAAVVKAPVEVVRSPIGHTHTCPAGHTWDHSITASHNCPFVNADGTVCGLYQNTQDPFPRPVTAGSGVYQGTFQPQQFGTSVQGVTSGCVGGRSCGIQSRPAARSGWYLGKNLGR